MTSLTTRIKYSSIPKLHKMHSNAVQIEMAAICIGVDAGGVVESVYESFRHGKVADILVYNFSKNLSAFLGKVDFLKPI